MRRFCHLPLLACLVTGCALLSLDPDRPVDCSKLLGRFDEEALCKDAVANGDPLPGPSQSPREYCTKVIASRYWVGCSQLLRSRLGEAEMKPLLMARHDALEAQAKRDDERARQRAEERKRKWAEWKGRPHWATAQAMGVVVPFALVCPDLQTVDWLWGAFTDHYTDAAINRATGGQAGLQRRLAGEPRPEAYGCLKVPVGTRVLVETGNQVPVVKGSLNGKAFRGVMHPAMLDYDEERPN